MSISDDIVFGKALGDAEVEKAGVSAPFGFFDPLGFYKDKTIRQKKKLRECKWYSRSLSSSTVLSCS